MNYKLRVLILIIFASLVAIFFWQRNSSQPQPEPSPNQASFVTFSVIGDPEGDEDNLKKALEKVKEKKSSFSVIVGDLSQTGTVKELEQVKEILGNSQVKNYVIPGNHDLWYSREENVDAFAQVFGQRYFAREEQGFAFVFLDNADEWQGMGEDQLNWLGHYLFTAPDLSGQKETPYLVFEHIPLFHPESSHVVGEYSEEVKKEGAELLYKFCERPPLAIFSGHLHHTNQYIFACANGNKIKFINSGSVNSERNWQTPRFLKVDLFKDGHLEVEEVEL